MTNQYNIVTTADQARTIADTANEKLKSELLKEIYEEITKEAEDGKYKCYIPDNAMDDDMLEQIEKILKGQGFGFAYVDYKDSYRISW